MISKLTIPVLLGVLAAGLAVIVTQLRYEIYCSLCWAGYRRVYFIEHNVTAAKLSYCWWPDLHFAIPLNLDVHFLFRPHHGGAASIGISASMLCVIGLYVVWIYRYKTRQLSPLVVFDRNLIWASILFMCVGILSLWNARHAELVFLEEIRLLTFFLTMLVVMNFRSDKLLRVFVIFLTISAFAQGSLASLQFVGNTSLGLDIFGELELKELDIGSTVTRATGTIGHPNVLGYYLEIMFPLILALLLTEKRFFLRLLLLGCFGLCSGRVGFYCFKRCVDNNPCFLPDRFLCAACKEYLSAEYSCGSGRSGTHNDNANVSGVSHYSEAIDT